MGPRTNDQPVPGGSATVIETRYYFPTSPESQSRDLSLETSLPPLLFLESSFTVSPVCVTTRGGKGPSERNTLVSFSPIVAVPSPSLSTDPVPERCDSLVDAGRLSVPKGNHRVRLCMGRGVTRGGRPQGSLGSEGGPQGESPDGVPRGRVGVPTPFPYQVRPASPAEGV